MQKIVKNWIFRARQNATELKKIGAIWKPVPCWVRKNREIWDAAQFSPSKWPKMTKNCQKLNFSGASKCDGAQKNWCHLKAFAMGSAKKLQNFGWLNVFTFKTTKKGKNWSKIKFFGRDKMPQSSKKMVPLESFCHGKGGKIKSFDCWTIFTFKLTKNGKKWTKIEIFRQNVTEFQKIGAIWKLLPWRVRKNYIILVSSPFSRLKRGKKAKIGQKLNCFECTKMWQSSKNFVPFESLVHGEWEKTATFLLLPHFHLKNDQKWSPLPGARQFKGDSLLVTLDPYPSVILQKWTISQK